MEVLTLLTSELKEALIGVKDNGCKEEIIFEHIKTAEKLKYFVDDFPSGLDWFNTSEPLSKSLLQGKIVVLDFFTYCCINCLHIIPHLRQLEENISVADGLVVVGVHSAKFENEKSSENILLALKRYNITHPVVNDRDCYLWNQLNISCWPTIVILGPMQQPIFVLVGEGQRDDLFLFARVALKFYKKSISSHELPVSFDHIVTSSLLNFPGKISSCENILALSDSGNHRILIFDTHGVIKHVVGGKTPGFKDGSFETAQFNSPQGLAFYDPNTIYIADTENHAIRLINLITLKVTTVVGNGHQGADYEGGKIGTLQEISSPWDVCVVSCSDIEIFNNMHSTPPTNTLIPPPPPSSSSVLPPPPPPSSSSSILPPPPPPSSSSSILPPPPLPPPPPSQPLQKVLLSSSDTSSSASYVHVPPPAPVQSSSPLKVNLNDSTSNTKVLLIAAAGTHQIWAYFIESSIWWKGKKYEKNMCVAVAGSGREENRNNFYPMMASFAQPSGLTYCPDFKSVFVADSESSCIRRLSMTDGSVSHVVGGTRSPHDLFSYGDVDGKAFDAKLQHPLGVAWSSKKKCLFVCDTYNHKIKKVDVGNRSCTSFHMNKWLNEPSGCCLDKTGDILYICDTNNNCIKIFDIEDNSMRRFELKENSETAKDTAKDTWTAETQVSNKGGTLTLKIDFSPKEIHGKWNVDVDGDIIKAKTLQGKVISNNIELQFLVGASSQDSFLEVHFDLVLCGTDTCSFKKNVLKLFIRREDDEENAVVCRLRKNLV